MPEAEAAEAESERATPEPGSGAPETTSGFIEAKIDGELVRYEYLPANNNTAAANGAFLEATAGENDDEGMKVVVVNVDLRTLEFPTEIAHDVGTRRLASMTYTDAEGTRYTLPFRDPPLACESFEDLMLKCTFSGTAHGRARPVQITEGRIEVLLTTNAARDAFMHGTGIAAPGAR